MNPAFARYRDTLREYLPHCTETIGLLGAPGRRRAVRGVDPRVDDPAARSRTTCTRSGSSGTPAIQEERAEIAGRLGYAERRRRDRGASGERGEHRVVARGAAGVGSRAGRAELGGRPARSSDACRTRTATSGRSRSSGSRTRRSASTTRPPRTARAAARTTSTPRTCTTVRCITSRASRTTRRTPAITSRSRSSRRSPIGPALRRFGGILAEQRVRGRVGSVQRAPRRRDGPVPGRLGAAGHARGPGDARRAVWSPTPGSTRSDGRASGAIDTMEAIGTPHIDAVIEVDRYIAIPGQALSYMIGMIEIERARARPRPRARERRSRSRTSTTGCSRSVSCRSRRSGESWHEQVGRGRAEA